MGKGKLLFVLVDCDVEDNKRVMEFFGITEDNCPSMRVINMEKNMAKYAPESDDISATAVKAFVNGVLDGSVARHLKSEDIPDNSNNAVKVVVGKNFNNLVLAKSDATANEFEDVEVQGFPTLKFFPAGEGAEMQDYNGGRTLDDFVKFLEPEADASEEAAKDEL